MTSRIRELTLRADCLSCEGGRHDYFRPTVNQWRFADGEAAAGSEGTGAGLVTVATVTSIPAERSPP